MLTKRETRTAMNRAWANWYVAKHNLYGKTYQQRDRVAAILEYRRMRKHLANGDYSIERNPRGNILWHDGDADLRATGRYANATDRYFYDCGPLKSWTQYDTESDASYHGVWVHLPTRRIFTYTEGDRTLVECESDESFKAELAEMARFYGPAPASFSTYEPGLVTHYYCARPGDDLLAQPDEQESNHV